MIAIIDYGVGNLFSLRCSFEAIGQQAVVTGDPDKLGIAGRIVLPGVGAFGDAAIKLKQSGMAEAVRAEVQKGKPLLGICLGMQLLFERGFESGVHRGLALIPGEVRPIREVIPETLKIPHIGWNKIGFCGKQSDIFRFIAEHSYVYFVHSYQAVCDDAWRIADTEYGSLLTAAVRKENVYGCQFHPEKSGAVGLSILRAFCEAEA